MIKKIQTRIIAVAFSSVLVILFTIVFSINLISYLNIEKKGDSILTVLLNNDGVFPDKHQPKTDLDQESLAEYQLDYSTLSQKNIEDDSTDETDDMYEETPFQTRFFTANLNPDGSVININNSHVAAFSTDEITNIVDSVFLDEQMTGYYGDYKFSSKIKDDSTYLYVFIDLHSELENFRYFRFCSITISCAGLGAFAIMTIAISYLAIRPAIEIEKKQKMFITNASHSFKTPLSIIQANNEVMESLNGNSQWSESISKQINKLTRQTNQLVYLSRLDEGNMPENKDN
ncbi:MAG: histidine kinase dimerization/phospho-acceptor domain-containing protein, partial [Bacilli bacterium]